MSDDARQGLLSLIPRGPNTRAWKIYANGKLLHCVDSLQIVCQRRPDDPTDVPFQHLEYGAEPDTDGNPSNFDTLVLISQGGALTLPFAIRDGVLLIGAVEQKRYCERHATFNPSGKVRNAPRGFHGKSGDAGDTARHELRGEVGEVMGEVIHLDGPAINSDNAWFTYRDAARDGVPEQGGVSLYAVEINPEHLLPTDGGFVFDPAHLGERPKGSPYEMIGNCLFVPWNQGVLLRDGLTLAATARLLRKLELSGRFSIQAK